VKSSTKHFLKNELNAFSNRGHFYGHFEKKNSNISKIKELVRKIVNLSENHCFALFGRIMKII